MTVKGTGTGTQVTADTTAAEGVTATEATGKRIAAPAEEDGNHLGAMTTTAGEGGARVMTGGTAGEATTEVNTNH